MRPEVVESASSLPRWADLINERFVPLQITPISSTQLSGSVTTVHLGHMQASSVQSTSQVFTRPPSLTGSGRELVAVGAVEEGHGFLEQNGRQCEVAEGSFAVYQTSQPFVWAFPDTCRLRVYAWPRATVGITDNELHNITAVPVIGSRGLGRSVAPTLRTLFDREPGDLSLPNAIESRFADNLAELSITAALASRGLPLSDDDGGTIDSLLTKIKVFIEEHLDDVELSSASIAAEFFISTRTLNRVFAQNAITVGAWVKGRRLERAKSILRGRASAGVPIAVVGYRCGFTSATTFNREFTRRYGISPGRYRTAHE
ncbi:AraC family transcriptional regulator [Gordonia sp. TBRC 11910]|uniref:AraC family transcriptional regulator n=1 Tax=Gordonia asplenii TaxID=2725283 RepID=A0A848L304_9ACTN|nr:AraC family transcriptional regulator [Gordonia asplenii]NMO05109.1 AraC family transcriptional regulator [Gordonia asplenii]